VVRLVEWNDRDDYDRLGVEHRAHTILGVPIRELKVPVRPGRDMGSILEMAARNELLRRAGRDTSNEFVGRLERQLVGRGTGEAGMREGGADLEPESLAAPPVDAIERESELPKAPSDRPTWSQLMADRSSMTESSAWIPAVRPPRGEEE
jgi:HPr kinase/phosphorylase